MVIKIGTTIIIATILVSCGTGNADDPALPDPASETTTSDPTDPDSPTTSGTVSNIGSLALAFPDVALSSAFVSQSQSQTSLAGHALGLAGEKVTINKIESTTEKVKRVDDILTSTSIADCFKLAKRSFTQPACFAPNLQKSAYDSAPTSFDVKLANDVQQLLYGDGGIVKHSESSGEACTAATVNFFLEGALSTIDQGREIFAALVCASKFNGTELPSVDTTTDYLSDLKDVEMPSGVTFTEAKISMGLVDGIETYTSTLGIKDGTEVIWAYFKHQPSSEKGHAIVFHSGVKDALTSANALLLQQDPMNPPANPDPNAPPPGNNPPPGPQNNGGTTEAVAVQYEKNASGDMLVNLDKVTFKGNKHPADYLVTDGKGLFDLVKLGKEDSGNNLGDNIVRATFNQLASGGGKGIVGWTASLSDSFWRSFAYDVSQSDDGSQTAKSTFGYSKSWDSQEKTLQNPVSGLMMFCDWAQSFGNPNAQNSGDVGDHYQPAGPSGNGLNAVQYQVSTRASSDSVFTHDSAASKLLYTVGEADCGADNNLVTTSTDGSTSDFVPPNASRPTTIGGVNLQSSAIKLD